MAKPVLFEVILNFGPHEATRTGFFWTIPLPGDTVTIDDLPGKKFSVQHRCVHCRASIWHGGKPTSPDGGLSGEEWELVLTPV